MASKKTVLCFPICFLSWLVFYFYFLFFQVNLQIEYVFVNGNWLINYSVRQVTCFLLPAASPVIRRKAVWAVKASALLLSQTAVTRWSILLSFPLCTVQMAMVPVPYSFDQTLRDALQSVSLCVVCACLPTEKANQMAVEWIFFARAARRAQHLCLNFILQFA